MDCALKWKAASEHGSKIHVPSSKFQSRASHHDWSNSYVRSQTSPESKFQVPDSKFQVPSSASSRGEQVPCGSNSQVPASKTELSRKSKLTDVLFKEQTQEWIRKLVLTYSYFSYWRCFVFANILVIA